MKRSVCSVQARSDCVASEPPMAARTDSSGRPDKVCKENPTGDDPDSSQRGQAAGFSLGTAAKVFSAISSAAIKKSERSGKSAVETVRDNAMASNVLRKLTRD